MWVIRFGDEIYNLQMPRLAVYKTGRPGLVKAQR